MWYNVTRETKEGMDLGDIRMVHYHVGDTYPEFRTGDMTIRAEYTGLSGWTMVVGFPNISDREVADFSHTDAQVAHVVIDDRLFLLAKFGNISWMDMPFEPAKYSEPLDYSPFPGGTGIPLTVIVFNSSTGMVRHIRMLGLSNPMSNNLHAICADMDKRHRPFDPAAYDADINRIYAEYPSSESMLKKVVQENVTIFAKE